MRLSASQCNMLHTKEREHGVSHGLAEAGYDIRLKQNVRFFPNYDQAICVSVDHAQSPDMGTVYTHPLPRDSLDVGLGGED